MDDRRFEYRSRSTLELIHQIVFNSNRDALAELVSARKPFCCNGKRLRLTEFLWQLRERELHRQGSKRTINEIIDNAYDLTLSKFNDLPLTKLDSVIQYENTEKLKQRQTDCRNYYRVVLDRMVQWRKENPLASALDEEQAVGTILQGFVVHHFYLSRLEALRRQRPFSSRYAWRVRGKAVTLWYPVEIPANIFREWLNDQSAGPDEDLNELRDRVQATIDAHYYVNRLVPVDELAESLTATGDHHGSTGNLPSVLARVVAMEKVNHIDKLRPAIRSLGKRTLEQLILRIFSDLADETFEDGAIAKDFGLSKSTFSRFAGSQWRQKPTGDEGDAIPDLWRNTAKAIVSDTVFLEAAQEANVSSVIDRMLNSETGKER